MASNLESPPKRPQDLLRRGERHRLGLHAHAAALERALHDRELARGPLRERPPRRDGTGVVSQVHAGVVKHRPLERTEGRVNCT